MTQHREKAVYMSTCETMVQTSAMSHDVKRGHTKSRDECTILYNLGNHNQGFEHDHKPPRCHARPLDGSDVV